MVWAHPKGLGFRRRREKTIKICMVIRQIKGEINKSKNFRGSKKNKYLVCTGTYTENAYVVSTYLTPVHRCLSDD